MRASKQVPLIEEGGIRGFLQNEVLPDVWYMPGSIKIGYEISFTRYFYRLQPLHRPRSSAAISTP